MHLRQKKSVREIARVTSLSRNTVRKYMRAEQVEEPKYRLRVLRHRPPSSESCTTHQSTRRDCMATSAQAPPIVGTPLTTDSPCGQG
jgi:hypothetical protein